MTPNSQEHTPHLSASGRLAALLVALALVVAVGFSQSESGLAVGDEPAVTELVEPGTALERAERLALVEPAAAPTEPSELIFPLDPGDFCVVVTKFGGPSGVFGPTGHQGIDIAAAADSEIYSVASGVLTKRYTNSGSAGWGWTLYDEAADRTYKYFHMAEDANEFVEGDTVEIGDVIGYVGDSGTGAGNYHLHFEVRMGERNSVPIDPVPLLPDVCHS